MNLVNILNHDIGENILKCLLYKNKYIISENINYLKNLCNVIPDLYKSELYKELFINPSNEILKTRRYFGGMTEKMRLISYDMLDDGYFDYQNIIYINDQNVGISKELTLSNLNDYIIYNISIPNNIKVILRNKLYGIAVEAASFSDNIFEYLDEVRWIDIQKNITHFTKTQRLNLINYFDYEFKKIIKDIKLIEKYKQTLIKHLYPNNILENFINSYSDDY